MKKAFLLFAFTTIINLGLFAQLSISWSDTFKKKANTTFKEFLYANDDGCYVSFKHESGFLGLNSGIRLDKYDKNLNLIFSKEYKADKDFHTANLEIKYLKDRFGMLTLQKEKGKKQYNFYIKNIDLNGKVVNKNSITSIQYKEKIAKETFIPFYTWELSKDKNKSIFIVNADDKKKDKTLEIELTYLNSDFSVNKEKTISLPYNQKDANAESFVLTNEGILYFIVSVRRTDKENKSNVFGLKLNKTETDIFIYSYNHKKDEVSSLDMNLGDLLLKSAKLKMDPQGNLICCGFYGVSKFGPSQGAFFTKISGADGSVLQQSKKKFDESDLEVFGNKNLIKDLTNKQKGLNNDFKIDSIIIMDSGAINLVAESKYKETSTTSSGSKLSIHYLGDIILMQIDPNGNFTKVALLPKSQEMGNQEIKYGSYSIFKGNNELFFVYNDHYINVKKNRTTSKGMYQMSGTKEAAPTFAILNFEAFKRVPLYSRKEIRQVLNTAKISQTSDNSFLIFIEETGSTIGNLKFRLGEVTIKDFDLVF